MTNKYIVILLIILIIVIIITKNTSEYMDVNKNIIIQNQQFTPKSIQAIEQIASMYNKNMLYATAATIPNINSTNIKSNDINSTNIKSTNIKSNDINSQIGNINNITTNKVCIDNTCLNKHVIDRMNNVIANELIYYKDELILWDNLTQYKNNININNNINGKYIQYSIDTMMVDNIIHIPDKYKYNIEITVPYPPQNANYDYSVIWLNIPINPKFYFIVVNNGNGLSYSYDINNNYLKTISNYYNNLIKNNEGFKWIPLIINNFNKNRKIYLFYVQNIKSIAFSTNPLNMHMQAFVDEMSMNNNYPVINLSDVSHVDDKNQESSYYIRIPYIYSGKPKIFFVDIYKQLNSNVIISIKNNDKYEQLTLSNIISYPLNKLFLNNYYGVIIPDNILKNNKEYIELLINIVFINIHSPQNTIITKIDSGKIFGLPWYYLPFRYKITYDYNSYTIMNFGTYDLLE